MIDLAITNPVSKSIVYSNDPVSVDPLRLLKKRELQKTMIVSTALLFSPKVENSAHLLLELVAILLLQQRKYFKLFALAKTALALSSLMTTG